MSAQAPLYAARLEEQRSEEAHRARGALRGTLRSALPGMKLAATKHGHGPHARKRCAECSRIVAIEAVRLAGRELLAYAYARKEWRPKALLEEDGKALLDLARLIATDPLYGEAP